jgi:hypothetical protein
VYTVGVMGEEESHEIPVSMHGTLSVNSIFFKSRPAPPGHQHDEQGYFKTLVGGDPYKIKITEITQKGSHDDREFDVNTNTSNSGLIEVGPEGLITELQTRKVLDCFERKRLLEVPYFHSNTHTEDTAPQIIFETRRSTEGHPHRLNVTFKGAESMPRVTCPSVPFTRKELLLGSLHVAICHERTCAHFDSLKDHVNVPKNVLAAMSDIDSLFQYQSMPSAWPVKPEHMDPLVRQLWVCKGEWGRKLVSQAKERKPTSSSANNCMGPFSFKPTEHSLAEVHIYLAPANDTNESQTAFNAFMKETPQAPSISSV